MLQLLSSYGILSGYVLDNTRPFLKDRRFDLNHCVLGYCGIFVDSEGDVRTGCSVYEPVGGILKSDLASVVRSAPYRDSANRMYRLECPLCTCGYSTSAAYKKPWRVAAHALRRAT